MALKKKTAAKPAAKAPAKKAVPEVVKKKAKPAPIDLDMEEEFEDREDAPDAIAEEAIEIDDDEIDDGDDAVEEAEESEDEEEIESDEEEGDAEEVDEDVEVEEEIEEVPAPKAKSKPASSSKAVVARAATPASVSKSSSLSSWGAPQISNQDIVIPKLLLMQQMSERVVKPAKDQKPAKMGQFRDSLTDALIANDVTAAELVPFYLEKIWVVYKMVEKKGKRDRQFEKIIPVNQDPLSDGYNDNMAYNIKKGGEEFVNVRVMNFYVLLSKDVAKGSALPYIVAFKSTGMNAGKKLATQMYVSNMNEGKVPPAYTVKLSSKQVENDDGYFAVPEIARGRESTDQELAEAFKWYQIVSKGQAKVDNSDIVDEGGAKTATASSNDFDV